MTFLEALAFLDTAYQKSDDPEACWQNDTQNLRRFTDASRLVMEVLELRCIRLARRYSSDAWKPPHGADDLAQDVWEKDFMPRGDGEHRNPVATKGDGFRRLRRHCETDSDAFYAIAAWSKNLLLSEMKKRQRKDDKKATFDAPVTEGLSCLDEEVLTMIGSKRAQAFLLKRDGATHTEIGRRLGLAKSQAGLLIEQAEGAFILFAAVQHCSSPGRELALDLFVRFRGIVEVRKAHHLETNDDVRRLLAAALREAIERWRMSHSSVPEALTRLTRHDGVKEFYHAS